MTGRTRQDIDIAEYTVLSEMILILKIASATPFCYKNTDCVGAFFYRIGYIKFSLQMASLSVSYIFAVYPYSGT